MSDDDSRADGLCDAIQGAVQSWMAENTSGGMPTAFVFLAEYMDVNGETGWLIAEGDQSASHSLGLADTLRVVFKSGVRNRFVHVFYDEEEE